MRIDRCCGRPVDDDHSTDRRVWFDLVPLVGLGMSRREGLFATPQGTYFSLRARRVTNHLGYTPKGSELSPECSVFTKAQRAFRSLYRYSYFILLFLNQVRRSRRLPDASFVRVAFHSSTVEYVFPYKIHVSHSFHQRSKIRDNTTFY